MAPGGVEVDDVMRSLSRRIGTAPPAAHDVPARALPRLQALEPPDADPRAQDTRARRHRRTYRASPAVGRTGRMHTLRRTYVASEGG